MGTVSSIYNSAPLFPKVLPDSCSFERVFSSRENYRMYSVVVKDSANNAGVQPKTIMLLTNITEIQCFLYRKSENSVCDIYLEL